MRKALTAMALLLAAGACQAGVGGKEGRVQGPNSAGAGVRMDARDNGRRIEMRVGGRFTVALRANYSTGYSWTVVSSGEPVIRQVGEAVFEEDGHAAGAGGTVTFEFRAERAGVASLRLAYGRPWEKGKEPADTFAVTVAVAE